MRPRSRELAGRSNRLPRGIGRLSDLSVNATNQYVVLEGEKGLCVVDLQQDDQARVIVKEKKSYEVGRIECNPNINFATWVASSSGVSLDLWDITAEKPFLSSHQGHSRVVTGLSWSRHNPIILATSSLDGVIKIWDVRTPKSPSSFVFKSRIAAQSHVEWSPHNAFLLASAHGGEVKLWDVRLPEYPRGISTEIAARQEDRFIAYMTDISSIHWATVEDNVLLTCSKDKATKIWNTERYPSKPLYSLPMHYPIQAAKFLPDSSHHIITSHASHPSLYMWDTEGSSPDPLFSLQMGEEPVVAFDFQSMKNSDGSDDDASANHTCVVAVTKDHSLRKWFIPSDALAGLLPPSPPPIDEHDSHCGHHADDFTSHDLALEFARTVQTPISGIKIDESSSARRTIRVSFTSKRLGQFKLRISFPTMYPHGATPCFEFVAPQTAESEHDRIELLRELAAVTEPLVAQHKLCLLPCLESLSKWIHEHLADIEDTHPPTPVVGAVVHATTPQLAHRDTSTKARARAKSLPAPLAPSTLDKKKPQPHHTLPPIDDGKQANTPVKLYTVAPTDTLMGVAIAFDMHPTALKKLNRLYSNQIMPGQQLWVHKHSTDSPLVGHTTLPHTSSSSVLADAHAHSHHPPLAITHSESTLTSSSPSNLSALSPAVVSKHPHPHDSSAIFPRTSLTLSDIIKQDMIYWSPTFCVDGTLTLTPHVLIFEPSMDDPWVIQGGILQFQLCIDLSQVCSIKYFRTREDFKHKLKMIKKSQKEGDPIIDPKDEKQKDYGEEMEARGEKKDGKQIPSIYPCIEIIVLHSRRMQTVYLGHMQVHRVEIIYNQTKKWAVESRGAHAAEISASPMRATQQELASSLRSSGGIGSPMPAYLTNTQILDPVGVKRLRTCLPARFRSVDWELLYTTTLDGVSMHTFYNRVRNAAPSLLLVEDTNGHVFGAYLSEPWREDSRGGYYGTGESFLFRLSPEFAVYRWSRSNEFFMCSTLTWLAIGGADLGFGLYMGTDFEYGTSAASTTFNSPILSSAPEFKCSVLEAWGFLI